MTNWSRNLVSKKISPIKTPKKNIFQKSSPRKRGLRGRIGFNTPVLILVQKNILNLLSLFLMGGWFLVRVVSDLNINSQN